MNVTAVVVTGMEVFVPGVEVVAVVMTGWDDCYGRCGYGKGS